MTYGMETTDAFQVDEWGAECPGCGELVELGDQEQARGYIDRPIECECGCKFTITWKSLNG